VNLIARARLSLASKDEYASSLVKLIDNCPLKYLGKVLKVETQLSLLEAMKNRQ
jgi:hypothetical protein